MGYKIAIDGPSGAGKGYVAQSIASRLGILNIDTGAMYRAFAFYCNQNDIDVKDEKCVNDALKNVDIFIQYIDNMIKVFLNGTDISNKIRTEEIGAMASKVSTYPNVRGYMLEKQRMLAGNNNVVTEGRDIGTVVFPDAELKIFLTASVETRAYRRYKDLVIKNKNITFEQVLEDIKRRDESDTTRKISPLLKTDDMIEIDSTNLDKEQVVEKVLEEIRRKGLI